MQINLEHPTKAQSVNNDDPSDWNSLGYAWRPTLHPTVLIFTKNKPPEDLTDLYKAFKKWNLSKYPPDSGKYKRRGIIRIK
tara:strand:- start:1258 stop:1500 length:243 start_codon:yes stop_codon:yes gene_type:complete